MEKGKLQSENSNCEYEYVFLKDLNLKLCTGCHICITKGEDFCPLKDDRDVIINKIEDSDGVILASPTFSMNVTCYQTGFVCFLYGIKGLTKRKRKVAMVRQKNIMRISYGSGTDYPQYAALHLDSSYFRLNYGPDSGWGTSIILLPSFWKKGVYYQGAKISGAWEITDHSLLVSIFGKIGGLHVSGKVQIMPPDNGFVSAKVSMNVNGNTTIDQRPGEAFKLVMLSSMHISDDKWDTQSVFVGSKTSSIPKTRWILKKPRIGNIFGLTGGTSSWKANAPTIEIVLDQNKPITGWAIPSKDPNDDNIGFWAASDQIVRSWEYTIRVKP